MQLLRASREESAPTVSQPKDHLRLRCANDTYATTPDIGVKIQIMSRAVRDLYQEAAELPPSDRAELAGLLLESLEDHPEAGAEEAWAREIERRMADYRAGRIKTVSWQDVRAHLHRSNR